MKIITITAIKRQGSNGRYTVSGPVGLKGRQYSVDCPDAGDAAAQAVKYALCNINGPYAILGSEAVMNLIPPEVRSKR